MYLFNRSCGSYDPQCPEVSSISAGQGRALMVFYRAGLGGARGSLFSPRESGPQGGASIPDDDHIIRCTLEPTLTPVLRQVSVVLSKFASKSRLGVSFFSFIVHWLH